MTPESSHVNEVQDQAALYALGILPVDEAKAFQRRLDSRCPLCMAEVRECRSTLDKLAIAAPEVAPPPGLRGRLLDRIAAKPSTPGLRMGDGKLVRAGDTKWEAASVPGVEIRRLHETKTVLVRMAPDSIYPAHDHPEAEQCLVLEGEVSSAGITAYAGDYVYMPAGSSHASLHTTTGCVFLIAYT